MNLINVDRSNILPLVIILSFVCFSLVSCRDDETKERSYELTWEDEFDGTAGQSPSSANWVFDIGTGMNGWGNEELQSYTNDPANISCDGNGNLAITTLNDGGYTSGRIHTQGKFEQVYGRFEARIKLPWGQGIWPAFWLLGNDIDQNIWPQCGEIDIMEYRGQHPTIIHGSIHGPGYSAGNAVTKSYSLQNGRFDNGFHKFRIDWGEDFIDYYVDDILYQQIKPGDVPGEWVFDHPFFIVLNVAVGGSFVGPPTNPDIFPQTMLVDYVRVYTEAK